MTFPCTSNSSCKSLTQRMLIKDWKGNLSKIYSGDNRYLSCCWQGNRRIKKINIFLSINYSNYILNWKQICGQIFSKVPLITVTPRVLFLFPSFSSILFLRENNYSNDWNRWFFASFLLGILTANVIYFGRVLQKKIKYFI